MTTRAHFDSLVDGLRSVESFKEHHIDDGYDILPKVHPSWKTAPQRLLVVLESLDIVDIRAKRLLVPHSPKDNQGNATCTILKNLLRLSWKGLRNYAAEFDDVEVEEDFPFALSVINFNARKSFHLVGKARASINAEFAHRVTRFIETYKPTHVLICGVNAASYLLPEVKHVQYKCGWVFDHAFGKVQCKTTVTLDLEPLYSTRVEDDSDDLEDDSSNNDAQASGDLLYYVTRNLTNLLAGKHLYSLAKVRPSPVYVDTRDKFKEMLHELKESSVIAVDTETANLESYRNAIYMIQFATSWKKAYVVPVSHPKTPFDSDDLAYIHRALAVLFGSRKFGHKSFITQNGKFDTRVYRAVLKLRFIPHTILEIQAGEHLLDENISLFARSAIRRLKVPPQGNLLSIFTAYGNDWYLTAPFSKEERSTTGSVPPDDPDLLNYCACDVQSVFGIYLQQKRRAKVIRVLDPHSKKPVSYLPFFKLHLRTIMSATVHSLSTLEQNGSNTDTGYMIHLLSQNSPLKKILADVQRESQTNENIQKANKRLLQAKGAASKSLFGKVPFLFEWSKPDSRRMLFLTLMGLDPPRKTDTGQPAIDKFFIAKYKELSEVDLFARFQRASKLLSTYVRGWYKKIMSELDSAKDSKLRAAYDFFRVVTGRLASFDPNLQQVPSRGELVKIIKRMFVAPKGYISIRFDYNAHEIRVWSIISGDEKLAATFKVGQGLRQQWIQDPSPEVANELKQRGDIHILNVHRFFGIWVDKAHKLRDAIKSVVFGVIYGMSSKTLGNNIYAKDKAVAAEELKALEKRERELMAILDER